MTAAARNRTGRRPLWSALLLVAAGAALLALVVALSMRPPRRPTIADANRHLAQREIDQAIQVLNQMLTYEPDRIDALLLRGDSHLRQQPPDHDAARRDFNRVLELEPDSPNARLGLLHIEFDVLNELPRARQQNAAFREIAQSALDIAEEHPGMGRPLGLAGRAKHALFRYHARQVVLIVEELAGAEAPDEVLTGLMSGQFEPAEAFYDSWIKREPRVAELGLAEHLATAKLNFHRTISHLEQAGDIDIRKGDPQSELFLATLLLEQGALAEAIERADRAQRMPGCDIAQAALVRSRAMAAQAEQFEEAGQSEEAESVRNRAIALLSPILSDRPDAEDVRDFLVAQHLRLGDYRAAANLGPARHDPVARHLAVALPYMGDGQYSRAIEELSLVTSRRTNVERFQHISGLTMSEGVGIEAAKRGIEHFRQAIRARPNFVPARIHLARLYLNTGYYSISREQCLSVLAISNRPSNLDPRMYLILAESERGLGNYDKVIPWLNEALHSSDSGQALIREARLLVQLGPIDQAVVPDSQLPPATHPTDARVRGHVYLSEGDLANAERSFRRATALDPECLMSFVHLAEAFRADGQLDQAEEYYLTALDRGERFMLPDNAAVHFGLGALYLQKEQNADAREHLEQALEIDEDHHAARIALVGLLIREDDYETALDQLRTLEYSREERADVIFLIALLHSVRARQPDYVLRRYIESIREYEGDIGRDDIRDERHRRIARAARKYELALRRDPRFRYIRELSLIRAKLGIRSTPEFDKMTTACRRAVEDAGSHDRAVLLRRLAVAYLATGDAENAVRALQSAYEDVRAAEHPDISEDLRIRFTMANALLSARQTREARAIIAEMRAAAPVGVQAYVETVNRLLPPYSVHLDSFHQTLDTALLHEQTWRDQSVALLLARANPFWLSAAEQLYARMVRRTPGDISARQALAELHVVQARLRSASGDEEGAADYLDKAEEVCRGIIRNAPDYPLAYRNIALIAELRSREEAMAKGTPEERLAALQEPIRLYQQAIGQTDGRFWLPILELAAIYRRAGANEQASQFYRVVAEMEPQPGYVLNAYENLAATEQRDLDAAYEYIRQNGPEHPFNRGVAEAMGILIQRLNEIDREAENLKNPCPLLPSNPAVLYHLALAYAESGRNDRALDILDPLLDGDVPFYERNDAIALRHRLLP